MKTLSSTVPSLSPLIEARRPAGTRWLVGLKPRSSEATDHRPRDPNFPAELLACTARARGQPQRHRVTEDAGKQLPTVEMLGKMSDQRRLGSALLLPLLTSWVQLSSPQRSVTFCSCRPARIRRHGLWIRFRQGSAGLQTFKFNLLKSTVFVAEAAVPSVSAADLI